jgi:hypothetical protein
MKHYALAVAIFAIVGCDKKPPILGTFEGTANVKVSGSGVDVKKDFTGVKVTIKPMVKETPLKKPYESENEVTITLENGPFTSACTLDGLYTGANNSAVIASAVHPKACAMSVDTWSSDVELSPLLETFGKDEVHSSHLEQVETKAGKVHLSIELRVTRKK